MSIKRALAIIVAGVKLPGALLHEVNLSVANELKEKDLVETMNKLHPQHEEKLQELLEVLKAEPKQNSTQYRR